MIQKILILGSVLAMAGAAQAEPVKVSFEGKSVEVVRLELLKASKEVCKHPTDALSTQDDYWDCVEDTYAEALQKLKAALASRAEPSSAKVASR
jgi:hypothetical protein